MEKDLGRGIKVNNGKGLYDNEGLIDTLLIDTNNLLKHLINGQTIAFCDLVHSIAVRLNNLKQGIRNENEAKDKEIAELRRVNDELAEKVYGVPVEKAGKREE